MKPLGNKSSGPRLRVSCAFFAAAWFVNCAQDTDRLGAVEKAPRPGMPIHLEAQLDRAVVEGGEIPTDLPPALVWDLSEDASDWRALPTLVPGSKPAEIEHTGSAIRIALDESNFSPEPEQPDWYGGIYVDLDDLRLDDWSHALVELRADRRIDFGIGFDLREVAGDGPNESWPTISYVNGPDLEPGTELQTVEVRFTGAGFPAPPGDRALRQMSLEWNTDEKVTIEVASVRLVPQAARFAAVGGVGVQSVSNSKHDEFGPQRSAIFVHAPADLSYDVTVPAAGRLDVGLGAFASAVRMGVDVVEGDEVTEVLPMQTVGNNAPWQQTSIDLARWAGRDVTLRLAADRGSTGEYGVALWSAPTVTSAALDRQVADLPNVIFYIIDGASAGQMSVYGYERATTPNLEKIAAEGVVFEQAHSNSTWTMPSTASFMTSLHHSVLGGLRNDANPIPANATTMAEHFHRAGFHTGIFSMNPNAASLSGLTRGVDVVRDFGVRGKEMDPIEAVSSRVLHEQFWQWREAYPGPYWVHFQTTDVHPPYHPPEPFSGRVVPPQRSEELAKQTMSMRFPFMHKSASVHEHWQAQLDEAGLDKLDFYGTMRDVHDEAMLHQDHHLGLLVDELKRRGEWDNTLLVIASDHGHPAASYPRFGRGLLDPQPPPYEGALLGEFESRIPMIFVWPGRIPAGRRVAEPVSMIDMLPTLLDLVGLPPADVAQGASLGPVLRGEGGWQPGPVVFDEFRIVDGDQLIGNLEILDGRWGKSLEIRTAELGDKPELGRHPAPAGGRWTALSFDDVPRFLLYDVADDPRAIRHVNAQHPEAVDSAQRELLRLWRQHVELAEQFDAGEQTALSPEQVKALQALGYIQ